MTVWTKQVALAVAAATFVVGDAVANAAPAVAVKLQTTPGVAPLAVAFPAAFVVGGLRFFSPVLKNRLDFILSFTYAAVTGLIFRGWLGQ